MTLQEILQAAVAKAVGNDEMSQTRYNNKVFMAPRIFCKDGFNISIQVHCGAMCGSENGLRTYGHTWIAAEWGFPSEPINEEKYGGSSGEDVGMCEVELLQKLLDEHGGIDLIATIINEQK